MATHASTNRPLDVVVLDLGNVLVDVDFDRFARRVAGDSDATVEEVLAATSRGPLKRELDRGKISPRAFAEAIAEELALSLSPAELLRAWQDIFDWRHDADAFIGACSDGPSLWLFSDTDPSHFVWCMNRFPRIRLMERFFLSFDRGMLKRDPGAFAELATLRDEAGLRLAFVDDRPANVAAARAAKIEAHRLHGWESLTETLLGS